MRRRASRTPPSQEAINKADYRAEKALQEEFESWLRLNGYLYRREPMHKATDAPRGHPDFTVYTVNGRTVLVEYKTATGQLSEAQRKYHAELIALGHTVFLCRSLPFAIDCLRQVEKSQ